MDNDENKTEEQISKPKNKIVLWLKRIGILGFLFFLGKGLLWLALPTILIWFAAK